MARSFKPGQQNTVNDQLTASDVSKALSALSVNPIVWGHQIDNVVVPNSAANHAAAMTYVQHGLGYAYSGFFVVGQGAQDMCQPFVTGSNPDPSKWLLLGCNESTPVSSVVLGTLLSSSRVVNDVGVSGTTLSDTTGLSFAIAANEAWIVRATLTWTAGANGLIKVGATAPAGSSGRLTATHQSPFGSPINRPFGNTTTTLSTGVSMGDSAVGAASGVCYVDIVVVNGSTPGTFQLQHSEANAVGTTTVKAGSYMDAQNLSAVNSSSTSNVPKAAFTGSIYVY